MIAQHLEEIAKKLNREWRGSGPPPFDVLHTQAGVKVEGDTETESTAGSSLDRPHFTPESETFPGSDLAIHGLASRRNLYAPQPYDHHSSMGSGYQPLSAQPMSPEDMDNQVQDKINKLHTRGTGDHKCPYGEQCTKGGVEHGQIKVFTRNSAFR